MRYGHKKVKKLMHLLNFFLILGAFRDDRERTNSLPLPSENSPKAAFTYPSPKSSTSLSGSVERIGDKPRSTPRCAAMSPGQMINALQSQVFGVTNEECQLALRKNDWSVSKSINYLKVGHCSAWIL